jgi:hypothetical protein
VSNTTGLPLDFNNDGVPDYLEDANGDGIQDDGEEPWNVNTRAVDRNAAGEPICDARLAGDV